MVGISQSVADFMWMLALVLSGLVAALAGLVLIRRSVNALAARRRRELTALLKRRIDELLEGSADYESGLRQLREWPKCARRLLLDRLASTEVTSPDGVARLRRLCSDLGLVELWRRQLGHEPSGGLVSGLIRRRRTLLERIPSLSFVARAEAAEGLGLLRDQRSWPLLAKALDDPNPEVRSVAVRALGRIQAPSSFPMMVRMLRASALGQGRNVCLRSLKMALAGFPLIYASDLGAMLQHPHRRVRFLAADLIATMVQRSGTPTQPCCIPHSPLLDPVADIFLTALVTDQSADVRARAADVVARLDDGRAVPALLTLLNDAEWFVRLHAVRALADCGPVPLEAFGSKLTDPNWRVREAAAQALAAQGERGARFLLAHFRATNDRYSREQVAEQIERLGLIPSLVAAFGGPDDTETQFIEGMVRLGRTASLRLALQNAPEWKRIEVLAELQRHGDLPSKDLLQPPAESALPRDGRPRSVP